MCQDQAVYIPTTPYISLVIAPEGSQCQNSVKEGTDCQSFPVDSSRPNDNISRSTGISPVLCISLNLYHPGICRNRAQCLALQMLSYFMFVDFVVSCGFCCVFLYPRGMRFYTFQESAQIVWCDYRNFSVCCLV